MGRYFLQKCHQCQANRASCFFNDISGNILNFYFARWFLTSKWGVLLMYGLTFSKIREIATVMVSIESTNVFQTLLNISGASKLDSWLIGWPNRFKVSGGEEYALVDKWLHKKKSRHVDRDIWMTILSQSNVLEIAHWHTKIKKQGQLGTLTMGLPRDESWVTCNSESI